MKTSLVFLLLGLVAYATPSSAQAIDASTKVPEVETTWPGIVFQIPEVVRIADHRLLMTVVIRAMPSAPAETLIGSPGTRPNNPTANDLLAPLIPTPFSLAGGVITEESTQIQYPQLAPEPHGLVYRPSTILCSLAPGQATYLTIQFAVPPPPKPDKDGKIPFQYISVLLPRAKEPVAHLLVPPVSLNPAAHL